jgi:hypothetical protein
MNKASRTSSLLELAFQWEQTNKKNQEVPYKEEMVRRMERGVRECWGLG